MQATIYNIIPFDAMIGTTVKFSWSGDQVFKNRCMIKDNGTNETVYDNTIDDFKLEHHIDLSKANLVNGNSYNLFITVFDKNNVESDIQPLGSSFICLKTPTFNFTNIIDGQIISSSSCGFSLEYNQENGELLDSWSISVYTKTHTLLSTSGVIYDTSNLSYTFSGFTNKNEYFIRANGKTINGISVDTGDINISVTYNTRDIFSLLEPTNLPEVGAIQIRSNIVSSEGHLLHDPGVYIDNKCLDLRDNELAYTEGFSFEGDFSIVSLFYGMNPNQEIQYLYGADPSLLTGIVTYRIGKFGSDEMRGCFELKIISNHIVSVYYSNNIPLPSSKDIIGLCVTRKDGQYNIETTIYKEVAT